MQPDKFDYDYIVIGSGFGGSVTALRLSQKGYKVLVVEKGKWLKADDFPKTNWQIKRWLWLPVFRFFGLFKLTFFRHVTVLSGVGVGGGSLVYANTLPVPKSPFFKSSSWSHLADWEKELSPFYQLALKMLGATTNPRLERSDRVLLELAEDLGKQDKFEPTNVAVFFGEEGKTVADPYFDGQGPDRAGCTFCGGCMTGCRHNAKNSLDKNYLYLAQKHGLRIQAESEVYDVVPHSFDGSNGYTVKWQSSTRIFKQRGTITAKGVVFSGGVLGTIKLLLRLKESSLPRLSDLLGSQIRTNSESIVAVTSIDKNEDFTKGVAIGSILHTDEHSHVEPVRYSAGSGFWRLLMLPMAHGDRWFTRLGSMVNEILREPKRVLKVLFVDDWSKRTLVLLFMQTLDSTLKFKNSRFGMQSSVDKGEPPSAFILESKDIAERVATKINGQPTVLASETLLGIPTTAHILGGAVMGKDRSEGVIDKYNRVFGYDDMFVCDGSMISANIGVNPSLTITAITEHAMSYIAAKESKQSIAGKSQTVGKEEEFVGA